MNCRRVRNKVTLQNITKFTLQNTKLLYKTTLEADLLDGRAAALREGSESGTYLRLIDSCITQLKAQGPSRTCNESKEEEEEAYHQVGFRVSGLWRWVKVASSCRFQGQTTHQD